MMKKKKNRFWLFILSLCPGAGHMYMGFMKMGISLLLGFMLLIMIVSITGIGAFAALPVALYVYSFFHANNIGGLDDEKFNALEDEYLLGFDSFGSHQIKIDQKMKKIAAVALIIIGLYMLWDLALGALWDIFGWDNQVLRAVYYFMRHGVPRAVIAIVIVWLGVVLLRGKKIVNEGTDDNPSRQVISLEQKDDSQASAD